MATAQDKSKARLPAPALLHSRNASSVSVSQTPKDRLPPLRPALSRRRSLLAAESSSSPRADAEPTATAVPRLTLSTFPPPSAAQTSQKQAQHRGGTGAPASGGGRAEAVWAAMQSTLEAVELSAASGARVFAADHARALDGLRTAQIALAQAWARSSSGEADETAAPESPTDAGTPCRDGDDASAAPEDGAPVTADVLAGDLGAAGAGERAARERSGSLESERSRLEEETENDIALARRRREANDRYFRVVNTAVKDVVAKLEDVAKAMKEVELESKDIWEDSVDSASIG
jgi:hypothetical protein